MSDNQVCATCGGVLVERVLYAGGVPFLAHAVPQPDRKDWPHTARAVAAG